MHLSLATGAHDVRRLKPLNKKELLLNPAGRDQSQTACEPGNAGQFSIENAIVIGSAAHTPKRSVPVYVAVQRQRHGNRNSRESAQQRLRQHEPDGSELVLPLCRMKRSRGERRALKPLTALAFLLKETYPRRQRLV